MLEAIPEFSAPRVVLWKVDGTGLTVVADADVPPGHVRDRMRADLAAAEAGRRQLPCVHWSDSFEGCSGTHVHGRGWKFHKPSDDKQFDLWAAAKYASVADWTEVEAAPAGPTAA